MLKVKNADIICHILTSVVFFKKEMSKYAKLVKTVNMKEENLHIF